MFDIMCEMFSIWSDKTEDITAGNDLNNNESLASGDKLAAQLGNMSLNTSKLQQLSNLQQSGVSAVHGEVHPTFRTEHWRLILSQLVWKSAEIKAQNGAAATFWLTELDLYGYCFEGNNGIMAGHIIIWVYDSIGIYLNLNDF